MSQRMAEIYALKDDILLLQRIAIVLYFEQRIRSPTMKCFLKCVSCMRYWKRQTKDKKIQQSDQIRENNENMSKECEQLVFLKCRETFLRDEVKK
jgi:hypothetical protein